MTKRQKDNMTKRQKEKKARRQKDKIIEFSIVTSGQFRTLAMFLKTNITKNVDLKGRIFMKSGLSIFWNLI